MKIEIWSDVNCPFCYIGKRKLEQALEIKGVKADIQWKSFQLDPQAPKTVSMDAYDYLANRYGKDRAWSEQMHEQVTQQAATLGLNYRFDIAKITNSFDAHRISHLAHQKGVGNDFEELLFKAYFTEGKLISNHEVLIELGEQVGLLASEISEVLNSEKFTSEVQKDIFEANEIGVRGVPFFVFDRKYAISGAQDVQAFLDVFEKCL